LLNLYKCSAVAEMGVHLATRDMGRKVGACYAPFGMWGLEKVGSRSNCRAQALMWNGPSYPP